MLRRASFPVLCLLAGSIAIAEPAEPPSGASPLREIATSDRQWTGVAVAQDGRLFVNYPRWTMPVPFSVGELRNGRAEPYPNAEINAWKPGDPAADRFVCVQSVYVDARNRLWVLDPANPKFQGVVPGGAKLVEIDLGTNTVVRTIPFSATVAPKDSYLNDVRIDTATETAWLTDSGAGALVVLDLASGEARRLLADHPSTQDEPQTHLVIDGKVVKGPDGRELRAKADGIALSPDGRYLYWQALTGITLWRAETASLRDRTLSPEALAARVEKVAAPGVADGIEFGPDGWLYLTSIDLHAIRRLNPVTGALEVVARDRRLQWPDSFAMGRDGTLYVTTSQIHRMPTPGEPFRILAVKAGS